MWPERTLCCSLTQSDQDVPAALMIWSSPRRPSLEAGWLSLQTRVDSWISRAYSSEPRLERRALCTAGRLDQHDVVDTADPRERWFSGSAVTLTLVGVGL